MAHTSMPVLQSEALRQPISYDIGPFHYSILPDKDKAKATYTVSNGIRSFSATLFWAFGSGTRGQSFLFQRDGSWYETRISFFRGVGIDVTPGHSNNIPDSLERALGREIDMDEAPRCFGRHATAGSTSQKLDVEHLIPGITSEGCHGPGAAHVAAASSGLGGNPGFIFNPARLDLRHR